MKWISGVLLFTETSAELWFLSGINQELLDTVLMPTDKSQASYILSVSCNFNIPRSKVNTETKTVLWQNGVVFSDERSLQCTAGGKDDQNHKPQLQDRFVDCVNWWKWSWPMSFNLLGKESGLSTKRHSPFQNVSLLDELPFCTVRRWFCLQLQRQQHVCWVKLVSVSLLSRNALKCFCRHLEYFCCFSEQSKTGHVGNVCAAVETAGLPWCTVLSPGPSSCRHWRCEGGG